jgi:hypothetical protein
MRIIAYTPRGIFEGKDREYTAEGYVELCNIVRDKLYSGSYNLVLETNTGHLAIPKDTFLRSVFVVER